MKYVFSFVLVSLLFLSACKSSDSSELVPAAVDQQKSEVGPFEADFSSTDQTYHHSFKADIRQSEGQVEYEVTTPQKEKIQLMDASLRVTGCPASQVIQKTFWIPDLRQANLGYELFLNTVFETNSQVKGVVRHVIRGLDGCQSVELSTTLKKLPHVSEGPACEGTSASDSCRVKIYCKEADPLTYYTEVEVWERPSGQTLNQYMNHSDGTRGLMASATSTSTGDGTSAIFTGGGNQLKVVLSSGAGVYSPSMGPQVKLNCQLY